ncbi:MAG: hypothetical protein CFE44_01885 [Burkholderiales bacterium PBB4]|nr:MAG: hypothetical protein CFE44_01885 [Burkholderiales bacterium PBB4]
MHKTLFRLTSGLAELIGKPSASAPDDDQIETIREAMFNAFGPMEFMDQAASRRTWSHIDQATEVMGLWYLRPELLTHIAGHQGEATARKALDDITVLFQGHVPKTLLSRTSFSGR